MGVAYSLDQKGRSMQRLYRKRIVLGVGGGIAAYKSAELVRRLRDQGAEVRVVMTKGGAEFIDRKSVV